MPSRADGRGARPGRVAALAACVVAAGTALAIASPPCAAASSRPALDAARIENAASAVRADPDLGGVKTQSTWRVRDSARSDPAKPPPPWLV
ncbi:MAG: hypothetical protein M3Z15_12800, partial [Pseudomonadota bacterium]|nr:hypothetical protein [Pseudomonadota bacterium]